MLRNLRYTLNTTTPDAASPTIHYELTNHLGNVMAVITDEPVATETPAVESLTDYYPFGMTMPGRSYNAYTLRHGFTGHEKESDLAEGIYTTEYRLYDARVGRWLSVDPLFEKYVDMSPYNYCMLNPLMMLDPDGRKLIIVDGNRKIEYIPYKITIEEAVTEFAKKAIVSLNYLYKNAPNTTQPVIDKVSKFEGKNGEKDIHIVETFGSNAFNVDSEIEWNSLAVDQCDNYYNYSPAENLFHELVHSYF